MSRTGPGYRSQCRSTNGREILCASPQTVNCWAAGCVGCGYKLVVQPAIPIAARGEDDNDDDAKEQEEETSFIPNVRPEECLREQLQLQRNKKNSDRKEPLMEKGALYGPGMRVLTVGDGDLSFSLAVARMRVDRLVATTHLSRAELDAAYGSKKMASVIAELDQLGAEVFHSVDATRLNERSCDSRSTSSTSTSSNATTALLRGPFDRVVWNFPCIAGTANRDADAQLAEIETNKRLLEDFFRCVPAVLAPPARTTTEPGAWCYPEVHVSHKTKAPFCHWDIQSCAERPFAEGAAGGGGGGKKQSSRRRFLALLGAVVFDRSCFPGYTTRKVATGQGSFPTWDAKTYVWAFVGGWRDAVAASSTKKPQGRHRPPVPPTIWSLHAVKVAPSNNSISISNSISGSSSSNNSSSDSNSSREDSVLVGEEASQFRIINNKSGILGVNRIRAVTGSRQLRLTMCGPAVLQLTESFLDVVSRSLLRAAEKPEARPFGGSAAGKGESCAANEINEAVGRSVHKQPKRKEERDVTNSKALTSTALGGWRRQQKVAKKHKNLGLAITGKSQQKRKKNKERPPPRPLPQKRRRI